MEDQVKEQDFGETLRNKQLLTAFTYDKRIVLVDELFPKVDWVMKELFIKSQREKDLFLGTKVNVQAIFERSEIPVLDVYELPNGYWPPAYEQLRAENPWWLILTPFGLIKIGRRKRVISIDWKRTKLRVEITEDNVTKGLDHVHAYTDENMFKYLKALSFKLNNFITV